MKIMTFESWQEASEESKCSACGAISDSPLCTNCEDLGWWIDPTGGVHSPLDEEEFEDPAAMYEKLYEEYYDETEPEEDLDPPYAQPKPLEGIGKFHAIDWEILHEQLVMNTDILKNKKTKAIAYNVGDLTDAEEGMLSYDELMLLANNDIVYIWGAYPIIDEEKYLDYQTFYNAAENAWKIVKENWLDSETLKKNNDKTGIFQDGEIITTVDKLMIWYGGDEKWFEDVECTNTMAIDNEHAQDDGEDGMKTLKFLHDHKNDSIEVFCEMGFSSYEISFEVAGKTIDMSAINKPFEYE